MALNILNGCKLKLLMVFLQKVLFVIILSQFRFISLALRIRLSPNAEQHMRRTT